jgi:hypothetical protein
MEGYNQDEVERLAASVRSIEAELARERSLRREAQEMAQEMQMNVLLEGSKWKSEIDRYKEALRDSASSSALVEAGSEDVPNRQFVAGARSMPGSRTQTPRTTKYTARRADMMGVTFTPEGRPGRGSEFALNLREIRAHQEVEEAMRDDILTSRTCPSPGPILKEKDASFISGHTPRPTTPTRTRTPSFTTRSAIRSGAPFYNQSRRGIEPTQTRTLAGDFEQAGEPTRERVPKQMEKASGALHRHFQGGVFENWREETDLLRHTVLRLENLLRLEHPRTCRDCGGSSTWTRIDLARQQASSFSSSDASLPSEQEVQERRQQWAALDLERLAWAREQSELMYEQVEAMQDFEARLNEDSAAIGSLQQDTDKHLQLYEEEKTRRQQDALSWKRALALVELETKRQVRASTRMRALIR